MDKNATELYNNAKAEIAELMLLIQRERDKVCSASKAASTPPSRPERRAAPHASRPRSVASDTRYFVA